MEMTESFVIVGGYGDQYWTGIAEPTIHGNCDGLTICRITRDGNLSTISRTTGILSPSTLCATKDGKYIYTTNETSDFIKRGYGGGVTALSFDKKTGVAKQINQSLSYGAFPAYINIDKNNEFIFVANHGSKLYCTSFEKVGDDYVPKVIRDEGCIAMFAIREDGGIGKILDRIVFEGSGLEEIDHASAHPHSIIVDDKDYIIVSDKGADCVHVCRLNREEKKMDFLATTHTGFGTAPRHAVVIPNTDFVLVLNEYDGHLCSFSLDRATGKLNPINRIYAGDISKEYNHPFYGRKMVYAWANDVQLHPNGRFVYTNIDQAIVSLFYVYDDGHIELLEQTYIDSAVHGTARGMQIDPTGNYLVIAGLMNEKIFVYSINQETGKLCHIDDYSVPTPTAACFIAVE